MGEKQRQSQKRVFIFLLILIPLFFVHCGDTGEMEDPANGGTSPPPSITFSSNDETLPPFKASGYLLFDISHSGEGLYRFDLINRNTQEPQTFLEFELE